MTRETKIGLLVGLAFIIVIGILLSDHLTGSTEPPAAVLSSAAGTVRGAVASPGVATAPYTAVAQPSVGSVSPQQQVPTGADLKPPVQIVAIGPGNGGPANGINNGHGQAASDPRVTIGPAQTNGAIAAEPAAAPQTATGDAGVASAAPASSTTPDAAAAPASAPPSDQDLATVAASHGEPLVGGNGKALSSARGTSGGQYVALSGDTLSKMAARFLGGNTKANRDAIIRANPELKDNPDKIIVGKGYRIPTGVATDAVAATPTDEGTTPAGADAPAPAAETKLAGESVYTVQANDSLWRIASQQLGSPAAIDSIKELNQDVLKGENHDVVYVGMKLKLPAKPLAQAQ